MFLREIFRIQTLFPNYRIIKKKKRKKKKKYEYSYVSNLVS